MLYSWDNGDWLHCEGDKAMTQKLYWHSDTQAVEWNNPLQYSRECIPPAPPSGSHPGLLDPWHPHYDRREDPRYKRES